MVDKRPCFVDVLLVLKNMKGREIISNGETRSLYIFEENEQNF